jgi:FixJ family two-component response regulator
MSTQDRPTVFVVDDDPGVRRLVQNMVGALDVDCELFATAQQFLQVHDPSRSGCLVVDVRMPGMNGLELQESLAERGCRLPVIVISAHADVPIAVRAMKADAIDVLEKPFQKDELLERVQRALHIDAERRCDDARRRAVRERIAALTTREREVLELLTQGLANKQIAYALDLGEKTIETHRAKLMRKLGVRSVAELVRLALAAEPQPSPA